MVNDTIEVLDTQSTISLRDFIVKYELGEPNFESFQDGVEKYLDKIREGLSENNNLTFMWGYYHFWEDQEGKYIKDAETGTIVYPEKLEDLEEYYSIR